MEKLHTVIYDIMCTYHELEYTIGKKQTNNYYEYEIPLPFDLCNGVKAIPRIVPSDISININGICNDVIEMKLKYLESIKVTNKKKIDFDTYTKNFMVCPLLEFQNCIEKQIQQNKAYTIDFTSHRWMNYLVYFCTDENNKIITNKMISNERHIFSDMEIPMTIDKIDNLDGMYFVQLTKINPKEKTIILDLINYSKYPVTTMSFYSKKNCTFRLFGFSYNYSMFEFTKDNGGYLSNFISGMRVFSS